LYKKLTKIADKRECRPKDIIKEGLYLVFLYDELEENDGGFYIRETSGSSLKRLVQDEIEIE
jgi:hypothetical protein